ncbi:RNase H domain-containing protein [Trichonephila clavipes]|nr:RNase H domain-containing protein [Trichonephila clavipes]
MELNVTTRGTNCYVGSKEEARNSGDLLNGCLSIMMLKRIQQRNYFCFSPLASAFILRQISVCHDVHFHWIPFTVNIFGNEQADLLAIDGCNASLPISSTLTYSEHQSMAKSETLKEWRTPPNHHWYESKHPGSSFLLKRGRASQTAISRLKSSHIKRISFCGGRNTFALCTKCKTQQASPDPILDCLELSREDLFSSPLLVLDFLRVNGLLGLV